MRIIVYILDNIILLESNTSIQIEILILLTKIERCFLIGLSETDLLVRKMQKCLLEILVVEIIFSGTIIFLTPIIYLIFLISSIVLNKIA